LSHPLLGEAINKSKPVRCAHYALLFLKEVGGIGSAALIPRFRLESSLVGGGFNQIKARSLRSLCFVVFEEFAQTSLAKSFKNNKASLLRGFDLFGGE